MQIYADNAATTKMSEAAINAMTDCTQSVRRQRKSLKSRARKSPLSSTQARGKLSLPRAAARLTIRRS